MRHITRSCRPIVAAVLVALSTPAAAQAPNLEAVARNLVQAGLVKTRDKALITGSVRDAALMEDIAIETMKAGGHPMIALGSDRLARRSYHAVPVRYDTLEPALDLAIVKRSRCARTFSRDPLEPFDVAMFLSLDGYM